MIRNSLKENGAGENDIHSKRPANANVQTPEKAQGIPFGLSTFGKGEIEAEKMEWLEMLGDGIREVRKLCALPASRVTWTIPLDSSGDLNKTCQCS